MIIFHHLKGAEDQSNTECALAMGYFDGLHIGHRSVIQAAKEWAAENGCALAVFTFSMPQGKRGQSDRILDLDEKHRIAEQLGVDYYIAPAFDEFCSLSPEAFIETMLTEFRVKAFCCGENFTFGARAAGNVSFLKEYAAKRGTEVIVADMACYKGSEVSSTRIRSALAEGNMDDVNAMLGQPYAIDFPIQHGAGLGHTLGFPTINQVFPEAYQRPMNGIYITRTLIDGRWYPSATGIGSRPTVNDDASKITCETFIPGFAGELYGRKIRVAFYKYLSPSRKFASKEELRSCVFDAADAAKKYFAE